MLYLNVLEVGETRLLIRIVNILMTLALVFEPVIAMAVDPKEQSAAAPAPAQAQENAPPVDPEIIANPILNEIVYGKSPNVPGAVQAMIKPLKPGQKPLFLNMSFNSDGIPQIQILGSTQISIGPEQTAFQQALFGHPELLQDLFNDPTGNDKTALSDLIAPQLQSIWDKVIASIPAKNPLTRMQKIRVYGGKFRLKSMIVAAYVTLVVFPAWAIAAHVDSYLTLVQDIPMFVGTTVYEVIMWKLLKRWQKKYGAHLDWAENLQGPPAEAVKKIKEKSAGALSGVKSRVCNIILKLRPSKSQGEN